MYPFKHKIDNFTTVAAHMIHTLHCIWWGYTSPTNTAWVQIPALMPLCGLSLLLVLFFVPTDFSSNSSRNQIDEEPLSGCATFISFFFILWFLKFLPNFLFYAFSNTHQGNYDDVKIHWFVIHCRSYLEKNVRLLMEGVDELCQDANKFNNHLRNVARQQQQKEAYSQRRVKSI